MRKAFCCLPEQLKLRKGGAEGLAAQTRGRHDPGRLVHLLAALMTSRLLETLELLEELKGPIVGRGGGGREVRVTTKGLWRQTSQRLGSHHSRCKALRRGSVSAKQGCRPPSRKCWTTPCTSETFRTRFQQMCESGAVSNDAGAGVWGGLHAPREQIEDILSRGWGGAGAALDNGNPQKSCWRRGSHAAFMTHFLKSTFPIA